MGLSKEYVVRVSKKGQIVIPAEIRRVFGIRDRVVVRVEDGEIKIIPVKPMEELFGVDGEAMKRVALEISGERLREIDDE